jgi:hypothetical protein
MIISFPTPKTMLEQIMNKIREVGQSLVVDNTAIPNDRNEDVMHEAGTSIFSALQQRAQGGDVDGLSGLLSGDQEHPAVGEVQHNFLDNIRQKFGIGGRAASSVSALIPTVLASLLNRSSGSNGVGMGTLQGMLASLTGNGSQGTGMLSSLGTKLGLDKDGDGDVDLKDLSGLLSRKH